MGSKEIRSLDESVSERSVLDYMQRKKLGIHFAESDERRFPKAIGGEYVAGGMTPVDIRGRPIEDLSKTGGWLAAFFIFGLLQFLWLADILGSSYLAPKTCCRFSC